MPIDDTLSPGTVLVTSADAGNTRFGSGFIVSRQPGKTQVLTCAHVLDDVGTPRLKTNRGTQLPTVIARGTADAHDIAVLEINGDIDGTTVSTGTGPTILSRVREIVISGFQQL